MTMARFCAVIRLTLLFSETSAQISKSQSIMVLFGSGKSKRTFETWSSYTDNVSVER